MTASPVEYFALFTTYDGVTKELTTSVSMVPANADDAALCGEPAAVEAIWDTGATMTCIKPALRERLKLRPLEFGSTEIAGVGGKVAADAAFVDLLIMPGVKIKDCLVYVMDFPGDAEMLIGMDIIGMGDFAVCNAGGKTSFSFAMPPFPDRINLEDKAEAANMRGAL